MGAYLFVALCWFLIIGVIAIAQRDPLAARFALAGIVWPLAIVAGLAWAFVRLIRLAVDR